MFWRGVGAGDPHGLQRAGRGRGSFGGLLACGLGLLLMATGCGGPRTSGMEISMQPIGVVRSPYVNNAPHQPDPADPGEFRLVIDQEHAAGLHRLEDFRYLYVLFYMHKVEGEASMTIHPPWAPEGLEVGLFASRAPNRPNPIGLSIVAIERIDGNIIHTSGLDAFDGTPILDIKPYIAGLDVREDANLGWVEGLPNADHLALHIAGVPHGEDSEHEHREGGPTDE